MNPINFLTIDLEDYFQVHAFSNVIRFENWDKHESRIERNTFRILEILNECVGPNNSMNSSNPTSVLSPQDSNFLPHTSNLKPQGLDLTPCSMPSALCRPVRATFFILGWIAERYPDLIQESKKRATKSPVMVMPINLFIINQRKNLEEILEKQKPFSKIL